MLPKQLGLIDEVIDAFKESGCVIITEMSSSHPLASVTVTKNVSAGKFPCVALVPSEAVGLPAFTQLTRCGNEPPLKSTVASPVAFPAQSIFR